MKNKIFMWLSIALVIALGYFILMAGSPQEGKDEVDVSPAVDEVAVPEGEQIPQILSYVPADTLFFSGGLEPAPLFSWLEGTITQEDFDDLTLAVHGFFGNLESSEVGGATSTELNEPVEADVPGKESLSVGMLLFGMAMEYLKTEHDVALLTQTLGISEKVESALYTLGTTPVLRVKLSDEKAFNNYLDASEKTGKVTSKRENINGVDFRIYDVNVMLDDSNLWQEYKAFVTVHKGYGLLFIAKRSQLLTDFAKLLGDEKPQTSLAQTDDLQTLMKTYDFHPSMLAYIDEKAIFHELTLPEGEIDPLLYAYAQFTSQSWLLEAMTASDLLNSSEFSMEGYTKKILSDLKTPGCHKDLSDFTGSFPRTVMGYTTLDYDSSPLNISMITLTETDKTILDELKSLRGFTPTLLHQVNSEAIFGFGFGLDVGATVPLVTKAIQTVTEAEYTCEYFVNMQAVVRENSSQVLMGAAAVSGMVSGIKGLSLIVNDFETEFNTGSGEPEVTHLDGLVVLSADNPATLIMMAGGFIDELGGINIPMDGSIAELPVPPLWPFKESPKVAVKGNHLVVFVGDKAAKQAEALSSQAIDSNSLMAMKFDMNSVIERIHPAFQQSLNSQVPEKESAKTLRRVMHVLKKLDLKMAYIFDFNEQGAFYDASMEYQVKQ